MPRILITTVPFGTRDPSPLQQMQRHGIDFVINPHHKKLTEEELIQLVPEFDILIAGTEPITANVMKHGKNLKHILAPPNLSSFGIQGF